MHKLKQMGVLLAVVFGSLYIIPPAQADFDGRMNFSEFIWIDDAFSTANTQSEVENHCDCSGVIANTFLRNDNPAKRVNYRNTDGYITKVWYVKRNDDRWYAYNKAWCDENGCLTLSSSSLVALT